MTTQSSLHPWWVLIGIGIASFLGCLDFTIVNTALPAIETSLNATVTELQWVVNLFILALSSFMVIMGRLADLYGRRRILYIGMLSFGFASLLAGLASDIHWLLLWRFIQGIACAVLYTASGAIVTDAFPPETRGKAMGIFFGISFTGLAAGPVIGGLLVALLDWRWVFFVNVPLIIVSFIICLRYVRESKDLAATHKIDYIGMLLLMLGLSALVYAITQANIWGWGSALTLGFLASSLVLLSLFYYVESIVSAPIIKFQLLFNRSFFASIIGTFFVAFFYCLAFFLMPLYLGSIRHESDFTIGLMLLPTTIAVAVISPIIGHVVDKIGAYKPMLIGFLLFMISAILQSHLSASSTLIHVFAAFITMGIAWGMIIGPATTLAVSALPPSASALAMGTSWTLHNIGGVFGLGLGLAIYHARSGPQQAFLAGYHGAMLLLVASSLLAFVLIAYALKSRVQVTAALDE